MQPQHNTTMHYNIDRHAYIHVRTYNSSGGGRAMDVDATAKVENAQMLLLTVNFTQY